MTRNLEESKVTTAKADLEALKKKTKTLENFTQMLAQKNFDLYLKHEQMLDSEKQQRNEIAEEFQQSMKGVQDELE